MGSGRRFAPGSGGTPLGIRHGSGPDRPGPAPGHSRRSRLMATVVRLFETRDQAYRAIEALRQAGQRSEDLGIVMRDKQEAAQLAADAGAGGATAAGAV